MKLLDENITTEFRYHQYMLFKCRIKHYYEMRTSYNIVVEPLGKKEYMLNIKKDGINVWLEGFKSEENGSHPPVIQEAPVINKTIEDDLREEIDSQWKRIQELESQRSQHKANDRLFTRIRTLVGVNFPIHDCSGSFHFQQLPAASSLL